MRYFRKCNKINQTSTGRGQTGVSVTDKLDMSQLTMATKKEKKIEKQANTRAKDCINRSMVSGSGR